MSEPFILDPAHQPFVAGRTLKLPVQAHGCVLLFMLPFVIAGTWIGVLLVRQWAGALILAASAVETEGQFVDQRLESSDGTSYFVTYCFVAGDQIYRLEESVRRATYEAAPSLPALTVRFAPHNPRLASIEAENWGELLALTALVLAWDGFVLVFVLRFGRDLYKRLRLARTGILVDGRVVACSGSPDSDGNYQVKLLFRFLSPLTHTWIEGSATQQRNDLKAGPLPAPGTPVHVLYLHDRLHLVL